MSDPLSIAGSVAGLITISAQIVGMAKDLFDKVKDAPETMMRVREEVESMQPIFCQVQLLLNGAGPRQNHANLTMIPIHNLMVTLTGCVIVYTRLEKKVNEVCGFSDSTTASTVWKRAGVIADRVKWGLWRHEEALGIIEDLQRQKLSLNLMLAIITCTTTTGAAETQARLQDLSTENLQSSHAHSVLLRDLISRQDEQVRVLEEIRATLSDTGSSAATTHPSSVGSSPPDNRGNSDNASIMSKRSTFSLRLGQLTYLGDLMASRAYKRLRHFGSGIGSSTESVSSFDTGRTARGWSMLSDMTLGDLSVSQIAGINLPNLAADTVDPLSGAASVTTVVQVAGKVWSLCRKYYSDAKDDEHDIDDLMGYVLALQNLFQHVQTLAEGPGAAKLVASKKLVEETALKLEREFKTLQKILKPGKRQGVLKSSGRRLEWPLQKGDVEKTIQLLERHKTTLISAMTYDHLETQEQQKCLSKLPDAEGAAYNHRLWEHEDCCLPDTRVELRQTIMDWFEDPNGECIFWLNGMAGTGKSTISRTVAWDLAEKKRLAASFFFSRGRGDISHAGQFFTTIATQLTRSLPVLRPLIAKALGEHFDILKQGLSEQWKHLILDPLKKAPAQSIQLVVVIDALDECDSKDDIQLILKLLAQAKCLETIRLRVLVTSRPETPILLGFHNLPGEAYQNFVLHNIPPPTVNQDISIFFQRKLSSVKSELELSTTPWPDEPTIQRLVEKAAGLFIYAATIYRFIRNGSHSPEDQLSVVLEDHDTPSQSPTKHLDDMYTKLLQHTVVGNQIVHKDDHLAVQFRKIVGSIIIMFDVMAAKEIAKLLHLLAISSTLASLRSVLNVPESEGQPVRIFHPSFRDFLLDSQRCLDSRFLIDLKEAHITLFRNCIALLTGLRQDLCNLREPGISVSDIPEHITQQYIPAHIHYACRYWFHHFQLGNPIQEDINRVLRFLEQDFLHWLEALSLIREISNGVLIVKGLEVALEGKLGVCQRLLEFAHDARHFIWHNRSIIEMAPLQVYSAALLFLPTNSLVRKQYFERIPGIPMEPKVIPEWSPLIHTFEGHSHYVCAVVFSPGGNLVASASYDNTVRLWDPATGGSCGVLGGHSGCVNAVVFSPDGKLVASASDDETVRLWDPATGGLYKVLWGHSNWVTAVVFSPDGKLVASTSDDTTVRLWDPATGGSCGVLKGHSSYVTTVVFSPDGKLVASASSDKTVRLWDLATGGLCRVLKGHSNRVSAVVFSPDGKLVASVSGDNTVRLWDPATGGSRGVLKGHSDRPRAVVFSPDGNLVASASDDKTVRLWDPVTGASCGVLEGHSNHVGAVVFSPDGKLVASASDDNTVRLWDPATGGPCRVLEGHSNRVRAVVFSSDGELVASASDDNTVRLWSVPVWE